MENRTRDLKRILSVLAAALLMALDIRIFVDAGNLFPGGATGLSVLLQRVFAKYLGLQIPYALINIIVNAFSVYVGFRFIGKKFTGLSLLMIAVNSVLVDVLPEHPLTSDPLLIAVFGGILMGTSIAICLRADATSGGTDFFSIYWSKKTGADAFNYVFAFNVVLLGVAGYLFGWTAALYSIVYQFCSTQMIHLLYRDYQQQTLFIVTEHPEEVCQEIFRLCTHGATIFRGEGSHDHTEKDLVYSVVSGQEAKKVIHAIHQIDPAAFINSMRTTEIQGKFYQKPKD